MTNDFFLSLFAYLFVCTSALTSSIFWEIRELEQRIVKIVNNFFIGRFLEVTYESV